MKGIMKNFTLALALILVLVFAAGTTLAAADLGGDTVKIAYWGMYNTRFVEGGEAEGRVEEAEELFNAQIEFISFGFGEYEEALMTRLLAGESSNDIWVVQNRHFWKLVPQGAFYPVSDILSEEYYENLPGLPKTMSKVMSLNGKGYGFGNVYGAAHPFKVIAWNKDLFEREGLPNLFELYENDEWTWDKMDEIAKLATLDTDGDGQTDQWGIAGDWTGGLNMALVNDARVTDVNENGKRVFSFDSEAAITGFNQWFEWEQVDNVVGGGYQEFVDGRVAMAPLGMYLLSNHVEPNMEEDYGVVPYPMGPDAADYRYPAEATLTVVLPANVKNPQGLIDLYHFLWPADEYEESLQEFIESKVRDRDSAQVLMEAHDNWSGEVFDLDYVLGPLWTDTPFKSAYDSARSGEKTFSAAMDEVKPEAQAAIDALFDQ